MSVDASTLMRCQTPWLSGAGSKSFLERRLGVRASPSPPPPSPLPPASSRLLRSFNPLMRFLSLDGGLDLFACFALPFASGFAPGFAPLSSSPERWRFPRRPDFGETPAGASETTALVGTERLFGTFAASSKRLSTSVGTSGFPLLGDDGGDGAGAAAYFPFFGAANGGGGGGFVAAGAAAVGAVPFFEAFAEAGAFDVGGGGGGGLPAAAAFPFFPFPLP